MQLDLQLMPPIDMDMIKKLKTIRNDLFILQLIAFGVAKVNQG